MNKKSILSILIFVLFNCLNGNAQSLNPTSNISNTGSADTFKAGYTFAYATSGTPWNGALISYGGFTNNYDTQISSDYFQNRISFRTKNGDTNTWNSWIEFATRGGNTFNGDQFVNGNQIITGNLVIGKDANITTISGPASSGAIQIKTNVAFGGATNRYLRLGWKDNNAIFASALAINDDLNVGIGTITPDSKLAVNGTIHSKEVKVDMNGWSDFVFKKDYDLPTLEEVEKHIAEKGHLENIPSEEEVLKNGINLGEMNSKLLQKIEELTLYLIELEKANISQSKEIDALKKENQNFQSIIERVIKLEKQLK